MTPAETRAWSELLRQADRLTVTKKLLPGALLLLKHLMYTRPDDPGVWRLSMRSLAKRLNRDRETINLWRVRLMRHELIQWTIRQRAGRRIIGQLEIPHLQRAFSLATNGG
ncbi:MAG: hypothetical protein ACKVYV_14275 [Limisphaerales bacterium]